MRGLFKIFTLYHFKIIKPSLFPYPWIIQKASYSPHLSSFLNAVLFSISPSCLTLCKPMDCSPPGSSVRGDSPGKNTEWVAMPSSISQYSIPIFNWWLCLILHWEKSKTLGGNSLSISNFAILKHLPLTAASCLLVQMKKYAPSFLSFSSYLWLSFFFCFIVSPWLPGHFLWCTCMCFSPCAPCFPPHNYWARPCSQLLLCWPSFVATLEP